MGRVIDKRISDGSFEVGGSSGEIGDIIVGIVASEAELNTLYPAINYDDGTLAFVSNATERKLFFVLNGQWVWDIEFTSDRLDLLEQLVQDLKSGIQRMGNFNPKTNTPALPLIPLNSEYDAGNYLEIIGLAVGEEFTWNGFVLTNGDWVIVEKDGSDIILKWNKRNYGLFAKDIFYDNSVSGLLSNNLQGSTDEIIARLKVVENRSTGSGNAGEKYYISTPATGGIYKASKDFVTTSPTTIPLLLTNTYQTAFQAETDSLNTTILQSGDWNFDFDFTHDIDKDFVVKVLFYDNTTELGFVEANILAGSEKILLQKSFNQFAFTNGNKLKFEVQLKSTHGQTISFHTNNQDKNLHIHTPIVIDVVNSAVQSALNLKQDKIYDYAVEDITALNNLTGMLNGEIAFLKDTGKSYQYNTLTTLWVLIGGSEVATFINGQYIAQQYFKEMPVISSLFSAVTTWVNVSNLTELQAAVLIYDFRIKLTANITLTTNLVINKVGYIDLNGFQINTAQDGTAPVTMITLNQDVYFRNGTIKHLKTTNTSVETVIDGTNGGFYADNSIMLSVVEFGVKFEKGYIGCAFEYSVAGILNNNMRFISISGGTGNMFVDYVNFPTQPATVTRYTNAILFNPTRWVEGSTLVVRGCTDGEKLRQFFISESAVPTNMRAVFVNNDFDDLNGGIFTNYANPLDKFKSLVFINNKQGSAGAGNYKGMFYLTASAGSNISIGTQAEIVFYNNKTTAGVLRAGYISLMQDGSGIFAIDTARFTDPVTRFANQSELMSAFALENLEKKLQTIIKEQPTLINKSGAGIFSKQSSFGDDVTSYATDALLTIGNRVAGSAEDKMTHFVGLTSTQINDITKVAGMIAYDTTKGKFVYQNGSALQTLITEADVASAVLTTQLRQTATIFVESTYGLDTNTGITPNLPYQTLAKAWTEITPSGEVKLLGATTLNTTHTFANTKQSIKTNIGISAKITGTIGLVVGNTSMQFQGGMFNATLNDGSNGTLYFENCNVGGSTFNFSNGGYKVIRSSSSAPTKINLTGTAGILYLENISGGEVDIDIGTGWIVYHINTQLKIGINNGTLINSTLINSVVTSQASLTAIVAITNNTANGFYIVNFDSPVIAGLTLSKGDIIYKVGAAHSKTFTFVSAPTSLDVYISATQRQTYIKQDNVWALAGGTTVIDGLNINKIATDIASATNVNLNTATGDYITITGTTTITGITLAAGVKKFIRFANILTLTHNATSLILTTNTNIITASGDTCILVGTASGVIMLSYQRANGTALIGGGGGSAVIDGAKMSILSVDIASATTTNLDNATSQIVNITGTTTIANITLTSGLIRFVRFANSLILTHSVNLILPSGESIQTQAGDFAFFQGEPTGVVRCLSYTRFIPDSISINKTSTNIASASTVNLNNVIGDFVKITGSSIITGITLKAGVKKTITFEGILILVHDGITLILPNNGLNVTTAAGDCCVVRGTASGVVVESYTKIDGSSLAFPLVPQIVDVGQDVRFQPIFGDSPSIFDDVYNASDNVNFTSGTLSKYGNPTVDFTTYLTALWNTRRIVFFGNVNGELDGNGLKLQVPNGYNVAWVRVLRDRLTFFKAYTLPTVIANNNVINLTNGNSFVTIPSTVYGANGVTLELTVDFNSITPPNGSRLIEVGVGVNNGNIFIYNDGAGRIIVQTVGGASITSRQVCNPMPGVLYHVSVTITAAGYVKIFVNGWIAGQGQSAAIANIARPNSWVSRGSTGDAYLNAQVTNIRVWNRNLSDAQVLQYYTTQPVGTETGLICYLPKGSNSLVNQGSLGGNFILGGNAAFFASQVADMIGGTNMGHYAGGFRNHKNYTPYSGLNVRTLTFHEWVPIPCEEGKDLVLIAKPLSGSQFWISGVAFSQSPMNLVVKHGTAIHYGFDMDRMGRYPFAGEFADGSNVRYDIQNWNHDGLFSLKENQLSYVTMKTIPNGKDKAFYIVLHGAESDELVPEKLIINGVELFGYFQSRYTPLTQQYNKIYARAYCVKVPVNVVGTDGWLRIVMDMTKSTTVCYFREMGNYDWL